MDWFMNESICSFMHSKIHFLFAPSFTCEGPNRQCKCSKATSKKPFHTAASLLLMVNDDRQACPSHR